MSILSDFEDRVARAVEGMFAGVFRSPVQPAELARAAAKEMDKRRVLGVGKVYAPTLFSILLSPRDAETLGGFADTLAGELETYLTGHAREKAYELSAPPVVRFLVDEDLKLGRFEVIGEIKSAEEIAAEIGTYDDEEYYVPSERASVAPAAAVAAPAPAAPPAVVPAAYGAGSAAPKPEQHATITVPGIAHDVVLRGERMVIGRLRACDVCLQDVNASREHAALLAEPDGTWSLQDLGSTNGTWLNGHPVGSAPLKDGDIITIGISELTFHGPRG